MKVYIRLFQSLILLFSLAIVLKYFSWSLEILLFILIFQPLFDQQWLKKNILNNDYLNELIHNIYTLPSVIMLLATIITVVATGHFDQFFRLLFFAAIPEEWFFRAYLMTRFGEGVKTNVITSIVFSLLHCITRGWLVGVLVFVPSLIYGWIFQKTNNIVVPIVAHALSNTVYLILLTKYL